MKHHNINIKMDDMKPANPKPCTKSQPESYELQKLNPKNHPA